MIVAWSQVQFATRRYLGCRLRYGHLCSPLGRARCGGSGASDSLSVLGTDSWRRSSALFCAHSRSGLARFENALLTALVLRPAVADAPFVVLRHDQLMRGLIGLYRALAFSTLAKVAHGIRWPRASSCHVGGEAASGEWAAPLWCIFSCHWSSYRLPHALGCTRRRTAKET